MMQDSLNGGDGEVIGLIANRHVILFDGVCKLCNAWSRFIIKYDKSRVFNLCSVQSEVGEAILSHHGYPQDFYETMLLVENGTCYEKSEAFFSVMRQLGWPWKAVLIFSVIPSSIRNWMYDRIALNRYALFGKYDQCLLPTPDHNSRFLDGV